ncbi:hypothetical protein [Deinococcus altitudinis]|uniref:hypothetical protein n=1 Tax=Deinococcus altitudinis TaxID=468914 RepID=UPI003892BD4E
MTDLHTPPAISPAIPSVPPQRQPYLAPHIQPLGQWTALTLYTSLPIGPGGKVFGVPNT